MDSTRPDLHGLLSSIWTPVPSRPGGELRFHVRPIPGTPTHFFGRDNNGLPCLLLAAHDTSAKAPIRLASIEVRFAVPCRVVLSDSKEAKETLTAVICTSLDPVVQRYFVHVCEIILVIVGAQPTLHQVVDAVHHLVDLFQRLTRPSSRSVVGLFGELYVIHVSASPATAVEAWRSASDDRFDFSINDIRLEVKASSTRQRAHSFSLEQCAPPPTTLGILLSLFVETSGGGLSLLELVQRVEHQLGGRVDLILKLQETVAEGLGAGVATAFAMRFDEDLARSSIRIYELGAIPAVRDSVPSEVSQIRFRSDVSRTPVANVADLVAKNPQVRCLLPARS